MAGQEPDFDRNDLYEAISQGLLPTWKFGIQTLKETEEHDFDFDILDATKVWPKERVSIRYIGELELSRNVDECFTQTEQAASATGHVVPGIGISNDPLFTGKKLSYFGTQVSRAGPNRWDSAPPQPSLLSADMSTIQKRCQK